VVNDQRGCPTYARHLAKGIKSLIESELEGIVHLTNSGDATWFDLAKYAVGVAGLDVEIEAVESSAYPTRAKRPPYSVLASDVLESAGIDPLPPWEEGVKDHLARRGFLEDKGRI
jgi:dTDP-4-dehydrorhamnose reductase